MNVNSPRRRVKSLKDRNQKSLFLPPYFLGNSVPKHNIRAFNNVQPEVKLMSRMPSMINEDDNSQVPYDLYPPDFNDYADDPFALFSADLFDDLEQNIPTESVVNEEPFSLVDANEIIPFFENSSSDLSSDNQSAPADNSQLDGTDDTEIQEQENVDDSEKVTPRKKRGYASSIDKEIPDEAINEHMLTPIFWEWINSLDNNKPKEKNRSRQQGKLFIKFLIDEKIDHPTTDDAFRYVRDVLLKMDRGVAAKRSYKAAINSFFAWTNKWKKYDDIIKDVMLILRKDEDTNKLSLSVEDKRNSKNHVQLPEELNKLMNSLEIRLKTLDGRFPESQYKYEISNFVIFCNMNTIKEPDQNALLRYCTRTYNITADSMDIFYDFFTWAEANHVCKNLAAGIKKGNIQVKSNPTVNVERNKKIQGTNAPIDIVVRAGFRYDQAQFLMQNDLVLFRDWLKTSSDSLDVQSNVLNFAHFLHSNTITTPTQQTLVDYYNSYLLAHCPSKAYLYLRNIRKFFQWLSEQKIYPDITVNVVGSLRKNLSNTDCPILTDNCKRKYIPPANRPLIVFH